jgi:prepilin-type N-terminal cleavage/methylation domain-containing protein
MQLQVWIPQQIIRTSHLANFKPGSGILFAFLGKRNPSEPRGEKAMLTKIRRLIQKAVPSGEKGFTLLEVMSSLVIFATGLLMMIPMIVTSMKGNVFADLTTRAAHHIQAKIEEIKNTHNWNSGYDYPETGMTRTWTIQNAAANLKQITVQMTWYDQDSLQHDNVVITYESHN